MDFIISVLALGEDTSSEREGYRILKLGFLRVSTNNTNWPISIIGIN